MHGQLGSPLRPTLIASLLICAGLPAAAQVTEGTSTSQQTENHATSMLQVTEMSWHTVDGGGGASGAGNLSLTGTVGQPESGTASWGNLAYDGGIWSVAVDLGGIFFDGFESGNVNAWGTSAVDRPGSAHGLGGGE